MELKKESYAALGNPVFFLSTGRSRTHWLTSIISEQKNVFVSHNPELNFLEEGKIIYDMLEDRSEREYKLLKQLVEQARNTIWLDCAKRNIQYVETNNRITFAAPILNELLPNSKFIHLIRNPISFIKSGINRNWYQGNPHDLGRIKLNDENEWNKFSQIKKIGWLWLETNNFIRSSLNKIENSRYITINSEKLDTVTTRELFKFMDLDSTRIANRWFSTKTNQQINRLNISDDTIIHDLKEANFYNELNNSAKFYGYDI